MLSRIFFTLWLLLHSGEIIQIYLLCLFWINSVSPHLQFTWSFLVVYYLLFMFFILYFFKHFRHSFRGLIIPFSENPGRSNYASCCFLLVSCSFRVWTVSSALECLCRVCAAWLECERTWPYFCQAPRVSSPLGHSMLISRLEFPDLQRLNSHPVLMRAGLWLWILRGDFLSVTPGPRARQKVF